MFRAFCHTFLSLFVAATLVGLRAFGATPLAPESLVQNLDQSIIVVSPTETTKEKFVKLLLHRFQKDLSAPLDEVLRGLNDPRRPLGKDFSVVLPVLQIAFQKNRPTMEAQLLAFTGDANKTKEILDKYEKMLSGFNIGVEGEYRISPNIESAKLEIDKELTLQEKEDEKKFKRNLSAEEVPLARADFKLFASPHLHLSNLKFFTLESGTQKRTEVPDLKLDLSDVKLGEQVWFYIISNLEQIFQRKENQAIISNLIFEKPSEEGKFIPKLSLAEAARRLQAGRTEGELATLFLTKTPVYIYSTQGISQEWEEQWEWVSEKTRKKLAKLHEENKLGYWTKADVDFQKIEAPFHFQESWFGSNLPQNYLDIQTVDNITDQVFKTEIWNAITKILVNSPDLQKIVEELEKDLNSKLIPKLRERKIQVGVVGEKDSNGKVVAHYETNAMAFGTLFQKLKTNQKLVYAAKFELPMAIQSAKIKVEEPLRLLTDIQMDKSIPIKAELLYSSSKQISFDSVNVGDSALRKILENLPDFDFSDSPLKVSADITLGSGGFLSTVPLTWQEKGADIDVKNLKLELEPLRNAEITNIKLVFPGKESEPLAWENLQQDLPKFLSDNPSPQVALLLEGAAKGAGPAASALLRDLFKNMTDPKSKDHFFHVSTHQKDGSLFEADFAFNRIPFSADAISCVPWSVPQTETPDVLRLPIHLQVLAQRPALLRMKCFIKLPGTIQAEIKNLKSAGGNVSHAYGNFRTKEFTPFEISLKLVQDGKKNFWIVPERFHVSDLLSRYDLSVRVPEYAGIEGSGFKAGTADAIEAATTIFGSAMNTKWARKTALKTSSVIQDGKRSSAEEGLVAGWNDALPGLSDYILEQAFFKIPENLIGQKIPLIPKKEKTSAEQAATIYPAEKSEFSLEFIQAQASKRVAEFTHSMLHEMPFQDKNGKMPSFLTTAPWKQTLREQLFLIPYKYSGDIESALFTTVQDEGLEKLTDEANKFFREDLQPQVQGMASSLLLKNRNFALPQIQSVCLVQSASTNLISDAHTILLSAQTNLTPVVQIPADKLPKITKAQNQKPGQLSIALGLDYINETLKGNQEDIRSLLEDAIKYEEDPKTGKKKTRKFISKKHFKIEYVNARLEHDGEEPVLVLDTRFSQPFKFWSRAIPFIGHIMDAPLRPLLDLDTKNAQIRISPTKESFVFTDALPSPDPKVKESGLLVQSNDKKSRELRLQPKTFRSLLTWIVTRAAEKQLKQAISIPMSTTVSQGADLKIHLRTIEFEKNWVNLGLEPELDPKVLKPFSLEFNYQTP